MRGSDDRGRRRTVEERIRLFGQEDHVRRYGEDFPDLLAAHGLHPARLTPGDLLGRRELDRYGIPLEEELWICARDEPPVLLLEARVELHGQLVVPLHGQGDVAREMLAEVEARYWRRRYERLAVHPVVGILLALRRLAIRLKRAVRQRG